MPPLILGFIALVEFMVPGPPIGPPIIIGPFDICGFPPIGDCPEYIWLGPFILIPAELPRIGPFIVIEFGNIPGPFGPI